MEKEVLIITRSDGGHIPTPEQLEKLQKEVEEKTGKAVIILHPGMSLESIKITK